MIYFVPNSFNIKTSKNTFKESSLFPTLLNPAFRLRQRLRRKVRRPVRPTRQIGRGLGSPRSASKARKPNRSQDRIRGKIRAPNRQSGQIRRLLQRGAGESWNELHQSKTGHRQRPTGRLAGQIRTHGENSLAPRLDQRLHETRFLELAGQTRGGTDVHPEEDRSC